MSLKPTFSGKIGIFATGTGVTPFLDLFDFLLKKSIYTTLKGQGRGVSSLTAEKFEGVLDKASFEFYGAFRSQEELLCHEMINEAVGMGQGTGLVSASVAIKGDTSKIGKNINILSERINKEFLSKINAQKFDLIYICGSPGLTQGLNRAFISIGRNPDTIINV